MTEEKSLDIKQAEKPAPTADPVEEKTSDLVGEIDSVLDVTQEEKAFEVKTTEHDDDSVIISKADLETLKQKTEAGENYKKGLLSLKEKAKLKKPRVGNKQIPGDDKGYLDKNEFYGSIEKSAIKKACEDENIESNWADILPYYTSRRGKTTSTDIVEDIQDAYTLFRKYHPEDVNTEDKDAIVELSNDKTDIKKGVGQGGKKKQRKTILTKTQPVSEWY